MGDHLIAPLFQGPMAASGKEASMLVSGQNAIGTRRLSGAEYLQLVGEHRDRYPQLLQAIVRTHAAAIVAGSYHKLGIPTRIVYTDACEHIVGGRCMSGSELMLRIWNGMPNAITVGQEDPEVEHLSFCTLQQIRDLLARRDNLLQRITAICDAAVVPRVQQLFSEEDPYAHVNIVTPCKVVRMCEASHCYRRFERELCSTASPSFEQEMRQERMERWVHRPFHRVSRFIEQWSGGRHNPEIWLAKVVRQPQESMQTHRYQTSTPT